MSVAPIGNRSASRDPQPMHAEHPKPKDPNSKTQKKKRNRLAGLHTPHRR